MRRIASLVGNLLIVVGVGGLIFLGAEQAASFLQRTSGAPAPTEATSATSVPTEPARVLTGTNPTDGEPIPGPSAMAAADDRAVGSAPPHGSLPITRVAIPRIWLDAEVVPAKFIQRDGGTTWEIPAFKAGHAEYTAGAGEAGNAILLGHVTSRSLGNVFQHLDRAQVGDLIHAFSGDRQFDYRVVDVRSVSRTDVSVLVTTPVASVSLFTCTGLWLPHIWDYTERLVVRAELISPAAL